MNVRVWRILFVINAGMFLVQNKIKLLGAPSTGGFPQCWGNYIFQSWGISPVLGKCILQFSEISAFIQKKSWIKPNEWNIFIIFITFWTQKKNYSFLASLLNCQKLKRKKHISPALGKSPRIEKCHFPSTGEIPQCWEPPDCLTSKPSYFKLKQVTLS